MRSLAGSYRESALLAESYTSVGSGVDCLSQLVNNWRLGPVLERDLRPGSEAMCDLGDHYSTNWAGKEGYPLQTYVNTLSSVLGVLSSVSIEN